MKASNTVNRKWLREASMRRLSSLVKNKTETIDSASKLQLNIDKLEDGLEESGLNSFIIQQLNDWVNGLLTGRQCMLAILDSYHQEMNSKYSNFSFQSHRTNPLTGSNNPQTEKSDATTDPTDDPSASSATNLKEKEKHESEFQPINILRLSLNLPEQFFCDSGIFYETIFQHPPLLLIRYVMQLIVQKTVVETSLQTLDLSQINIAIKQLKIDAFCGVNHAEGLLTELTSSSPLSDERKNGDAENTEDSVSLNISSLENVFITSVLIELIRVYVLSSIQKKTLMLTLQKYNYPFDTSSSGSLEADDHLYVFNHLNDRSSTSSTMRALQQSMEPEMNFSILEYYLNIPMKTIQEETLAKLKAEGSKSSDLFDTKKSATATPTGPPDYEIEVINNTLKSYLKQLQTLKQFLGTQLKQVKESRAFMIFGLNVNATEEMIKKAYRSLAIKFHPDKPGGNTAKFQQLQVYYQEILSSIRQRTIIHENDFETAEIFQKFPKKGKNFSKKNDDDADHSTAADGFEDMEDYLSSFMKEKTAKDVDSQSAEEDVHENEESSPAPQTSSEDEVDQEEVNTNTTTAATASAKETRNKKRPDLKDDDSTSSSTTSSEKENMNRNQFTTKKAQTKEKTRSPEHGEGNDEPQQKEEEEEGEDEEREADDVDDDDDDDLLESIDEIIAKYTKNTELLFPEKEIESKNKTPTASPQAKKDKQPSITNEEADGTSSRTTTSHSIKEKFVFPELSTDYETHEEHAMIIYHYIESLLSALQQYSHQFSIFLQYNLKWQKNIEKNFSFYQEDVIPALVIGFHEFQKRFVPALQRTNTGSSSSSLPSQQQTGAGANSSYPLQYPDYTTSMEDSVHIIETICEISQKISQVGMELTSECGVEYANTIRHDIDFVNTIEKTMKLSITTLQMVVPFVSNSQQLSSSYRRINESFAFAIDGNNMEIAKILIQMIQVGLSNNSKLYMNVMDQLMKLMSTIHQLKEIIRYLLQKTKEDVIQQMKKKVERKANGANGNMFHNFFQSMNGGGGLGDENEDDIIDQMDYCQEDKDLLKQARRKEKEEQARRAKEGPSSPDEQEEEKKEENPFGKDDEDEEGDGLLNNLKNKIKLLQYQLQCQQVNALKTLNQELITIQCQLMEEFQSIPLYSSFDELLNDKMKSFRQLTGQEKKIATLPSSTSSSAAAVKNNGKSQSIQECVFSLIAECMDNSLFLFRNAIMAIDEYYLDSLNRKDFPSNYDHEEEEDSEEEEDDYDDFFSTYEDIYDFDHLGSGRKKKKQQREEEKRKKKLERVNNVKKQQQQQQPQHTFEELIQEKVLRYFSWLFITFLNNENVCEMMIEVCQQKKYHLLQSFLSSSSSSSSSVTPTEESSSPKQESSSPPAVVAPQGKLPKIALLPDYRSKLLYFGALVDMNQIQSMIKQELPGKLHEILEEWNEARNTSSFSSHVEFTNY